MGWYEGGIASVAAAAAASYATLKGDTTRDVELDELAMYCNAATASSILLGRPANTPVDTTTVLLNARKPDSQVAALTRWGTAWSTAPTVPTVVFRRITLPATIGAGVVWVWAYGFGIDLSKTVGSTMWLVLWNFGAGAGSVLNCYAVVEE